MTIYFGIRSTVFLFVLTFAAIALAEETYNQPKTVPPGCAAILREIRTASSNPNLRTHAVARGTDIANHVDCFAQLLIPTAADVTSLRQAAKQSSNRQVGSANSTAGTTSAVSQPFSLLSLASEYGGLTTSTNSGTFTLQTSLDQAASALAKDHFIDVCRLGTERIHCLRERYLDVLHRFSLTTTFNTSTSSKTVSALATGSQQGGTQQVTLTPHGSESPSLASMTFKSVLLNDRADAAGPWAKAISSATNVTKLAQALSAKVTTLSAQFGSNYYYLLWQACTRQALDKTRDSELEPVFLNYYGRLFGILVKGETFECEDKEIERAVAALGIPKPTAPRPDDNIRASLLAVEGSLNDYSSEVTKLQNSIKNPVLTFEYDWNRPQNQPTNSVFKLIFSKNVLDGAKKNTIWTFTGNFAASIYDSEPASTIPGASRLRDIQAGAEADRVLPTIPLLGQTTLSAAYYFQDQTSPSILKVTPASPITGITFTGLPSNATQVFTQKGNIHLAQLKWALGTGKNVRFPFAFSYSNRTELIQKPDWRGQFGVSYDFSSFLSGQNNASP